MALSLSLSLSPTAQASTGLWYAVTTGAVVFLPYGVLMIQDQQALEQYVQSPAPVRFRRVPIRTAAHSTAACVPNAVPGVRQTYLTVDEEGFGTNPHKVQDADGPDRAARHAHGWPRGGRWRSRSSWRCAASAELRLVDLRPVPP